MIRPSKPSPTRRPEPEGLGAGSPPAAGWFAGLGAPGGFGVVGGGHGVPAGLPKRSRLRVFHTAPAMGMAAALLAASAGGLRSRALPRWTCLVGLATSALLLIDITEDLATTGTNLGPLGLVAVGLACVWIVGVCVAAWRQPAAPIAAEG